MTKIYVEDNDSVSVEGALHNITEYAEGMSLSDREAVVRILSNLLPMVREPDSLKSINIRRAIVVSIMRIISQCGEENKYAGMQCASEFRRIVGPEISITLDTISRLTFLREAADRAKKFMSSSLICGGNKRKRLIGAVRACIDKGLDKLGEEPADLASLAWLNDIRFALDGLRSSIDHRELEECSIRVEDRIGICFSAIRREWKEDHVRQRLIMSLYLNLLTPAEDVLIEGIMEHEYVQRATLHVITSLSILGLAFETGNGWPLLDKLICVFARKLISSAVEFERFCTRALYRLSATAVKDDSGREVHIALSNAITLAELNLKFKQPELALLVLEDVLIYASANGATPRVLDTIWNCSDILIKHYSILIEAFFLPLSGISELYIGQVKNLDDFYVRFLSKLQTRAGEDEVEHLLDKIISARSALEGNFSHSLVPLLLLRIKHHQSHEIDRCRQTCNLALDILQRSEAIDPDQVVSSLRSLFTIASYQQEHAKDALASTCKLIRATYQSIPKDPTVDLFFIDRACAFLAPHRANELFDYQELIDVLEMFSAKQLLERIKCKAGAEEDERADLFIRIAESGTESWREKLPQILHLSAQTLLDYSDFSQPYVDSALSKYRKLHVRLLSQSVVNENLLKKVRFDIGYLLSRQHDLVGAVQMLKDAMPLTQNALDQKKMKRTLVILEELTKAGQTEDALAIATGIIGSGVLSAGRPSINWLSDLMLLFMENNYPLVAEKLLTCALNAWEHSAPLESLMCLSLSVHHHLKISALAQLRMYTKTRAWLYPNLARIEQRLTGL